MNVFDQLKNKALTAKTFAETGIAAPSRPDRVLRSALAFHRFGPTPAAGYAVSAARFPDQTAIIDDLGELSFQEVHERSNALAHALADKGVGEGDNIALLCRNHRGFIETVVAASKLGANCLFLNTAFSGPQITEVCEREEPHAIVYDEEFKDLCEGALKDRHGFVGWTDSDVDDHDPTLEKLIEDGDSSDVVAPNEKGRVVILTSGTTGSPKGASRKQPDSLDPVAQLFERIPLKARQRTHIAAPLFHSWGFLHFSLGMSLSSTVVLTRRFKPQEMLEQVEEHDCSALIVVPVMLQRTLELDEKTLDAHPMKSLKIIAASGSALPGELATKIMDQWGDVLYNLYGSTEVAWAAIATPKDMREAPGTSGKPPRGTVIKIYDDEGKEVAEGETGRIFVGNDMSFEGYTGGGGKDEIDGLLSSGDVGHFDEDGRLFIDGRDDEMIVSGGENVFPREVEDLLADHEDVEEAAVIGVDDEEYGQRLKAFVVVRGGGKGDEDKLKKHVKSNLAGYKVPREIVFLDELPRNATGKVVKRELAERDDDDGGSSDD